MSKHAGFVGGCSCWKCTPGADRQLLTCIICGKPVCFTERHFYRRFKDIPFGVRCGCCNLHNHQPRCKACGSQYLKKRFSALAHMKNLLGNLGIKQGRLTADTYIQSVTLDVSRLSAAHKHTLIDALVAAFDRGPGRPELNVKTGNSSLKL